MRRITKSFSSNTWATNDYYQFSTNTTGQSAVQILFDQTSSGTGPAAFKVSYSTNGGGSFTDLPAGSYLKSPFGYHSFVPATSESRP